MATNSLLAAIKLPYGAFADDLKFAVDIVKNNRKKTRDNIDVVANWAEAHHMPFLIDKSCEMRCGRNQPNNAYTLCKYTMARLWTKIVHLGVIRSSNAHHIVINVNCRCMPKQ